MRTPIYPVRNMLVNSRDVITRRSGNSKAEFTQTLSESVQKKRYETWRAIWWNSPEDSSDKLMLHAAVELKIHVNQENLATELKLCFAF